MKTFAFIHLGLVHEIFAPRFDEDSKEIAIEKRFHADFVASLIDITDLVPQPQVGWSYAGGEFSPVKAPTAFEIRKQRNIALSGTDWLVARHQDEAIAGSAHTLTVEQCAALIAYRKALRDLPAANGFPNVALPSEPDFIGVK